MFSAVLCSPIFEHRVTFRCTTMARSMEPLNTVSPLDGRSVRCEAPGCDAPALYLFCSISRLTIHGTARYGYIYQAYCGDHAGEAAKGLGLSLSSRGVAALH
jgi:hypothetical protein